MAETPNHGYNRPDKGMTDWDIDVNENFTALETDVENRGEGAPGGSYNASIGSKYLDTQSGIVYRGVDDGTGTAVWTPAFLLGTYENDTSALFRIGPSETISIFGSDYNCSGSVLHGEFATIEDGVRGAVIAGGGRYDETGGTTEENTVTGHFGTVGGGSNNQAGDGDSNPETAAFATVGGGDGNTASGPNATVGGGNLNTASSDIATVAGGFDNEASGLGATVGGGGANTASDSSATVGGGDSNNASGGSATVGGGFSNTASGNDATVGGGSQNTASGSWTTVPGGRENTADAPYSFAVGRKADTNLYDGAVVFGDSTTTSIQAQNPDEFRSQMPMYAPAFNTTSARAKKTNIGPVDPQAALEGVESLSIHTWELDHQADGRHIGPMAEDFHDAFGFADIDGTSESIATVDADGVAFAAIQGLKQQLDEKDGELREELEEKVERIENLEAENSQLQDRITELESKFEAVEAHLELEETGDQPTRAAE